MKKIYNTPEFDMVSVATSDIMTLSANADGIIKSYSFSSIINGEAGWMTGSDNGF